MATTAPAGTPSPRLWRTCSNSSFVAAWLRRSGASAEFRYVPGKPLDHSQANDIMRRHPSKADQSVARKEMPHNAAIGAHAACSAPFARLASGVYHVAATEGDGYRAQPDDRPRAPVGQPDADRGDRRHAEGRHLPAHADRSGQGGARLVPRPRRGAGLHGDHRRHGRHVRAARGSAQRCAADRHGQSPRYPAHRRQVRRRAGCAWRAGGPAGAACGGLRDLRADRGRQLDQRGGIAVPAGLRRLRCVRRRVRAGLGLRAHRPRRRGVRRCAGSDRLRGEAALRRPPFVGFLRAAHRAGAAAGGRRQGGRHRHRHPGRALV